MENCFSGNESPLHVKHPDADGMPTVAYSETRTRALTSEKMANITTIDSDRRPVYHAYLPHPALSQHPRPLPLPDLLAPDHHLSPQTLQQNRSPVLEHEKEANAGCDGTGHKNPFKWAQGHTTKAGCPRLK